MSAIFDFFFKKKELSVNSNIREDYEKKYE